MAAILTPEALPSARPALRVIDGGRSRAARRRAAQYRRRRLAVLVGLVVVVALLWTVADAATGLLDPQRDGTASPAAAIDSTPAPTHVVQPGETLWAIAQQIAPNRDPRAVVDELVRLNGSAALTPGQRLVLPG